MYSKIFLEEHLGRSKYQRLDDEDFEKVNYRNGYSKKNLRRSFGDIDLNISRNRNGEFEPKIVKKYKTICNELDKKIISLYAKGKTSKFKYDSLERILSRGNLFLEMNRVISNKDSYGVDEMTVYELKQFLKTH